MVRAGLGHDGCAEPCAACLGTDVTAAVSVGAAMLLIAAPDTAHRLPWVRGAGCAWHPLPATTGCWPGRGTWGIRMKLSINHSRKRAGFEC